MSNTQGLGEAYGHYKELWNQCERLLVSVPRQGERCFYFPQGHFEQLSFSTEQEFHHGASHFNVPSQILCRVLNVQLLVEPETNEIYYCFTLIPDPQSDPTVPDPNPPEIQREEIHSMFNILMASLITSTHGVSGRQESPIPSSSEISRQNVHLGALATASHSVITGAMFMVYYKQRASQFVIRLNKYLEAVNQNIHVGMRFKMRFQREDSLNEMLSYGTIVGIRDFSLQWPNSNWRSLQVQWDIPASIQRPERVSPWEIEPILAPRVRNVSNPISVKSDRFKPCCIPSSKLAFNSNGSPQGNFNNMSEMRVDGIWTTTSPLLNESSSFISEHGKDKDGLNEFSSLFHNLEVTKLVHQCIVSMQDKRRQPDFGFFTDRWLLVWRVLQGTRKELKGTIAEGLLNKPWHFDTILSHRKYEMNYM